MLCKMDSHCVTFRSTNGPKLHWLFGREMAKFEVRIKK
jgi:hypothetical protein